MDLRMELRRPERERSFICCQDCDGFQSYVHACVKFVQPCVQTDWKIWVTQ